MFQMVVLDLSRSCVTLLFVIDKYNEIGYNSLNTIGEMEVVTMIQALMAAVAACVVLCFFFVVVFSVCSIVCSVIRAYFGTGQDCPRILGRRDRL